MRKQNNGMARFRMLDDVDKHLAHSVKKENFDLLGKLFRMTVIMKLDGNPVLALHPFRQPFDRRLEAQFIENRRAEFKCEGLRIRDRLIDENANIFKRMLMDRRQARSLQ